MLSLYKNDVKRILKDKLFLAACIVAASFAVITPLFNKLIFGVLLDTDNTFLAEIGIDARTMFFSAFSPGNNLGLVGPILLGIALCKDFSFGTVRNKIIGGKPRTLVFLSYFLSCATALCILVFSYAFLTLGISLVLFKYQLLPFALKDFGYILATLGMNVLVYLFIGALVSFLCVAMKNAGLAVVIYVAANFLFSIIGGIISAVGYFIDPSKKVLAEFFKFLERCNVFAGTYIGVTPSYDLEGVLAVMLGTLCGIALFLGLGILIFKKKDLK